MTEPLPKLFAFDIARQSTQQQGFAAVLQVLAVISAKISSLTDKVNILMSEDATVGPEIAQLLADQQATLTAVRSLQGLLVALQAEVDAGNLSQATLDAITQAQQAEAALRAEAEADVAADSPPSGA